MAEESCRKRLRDEGTCSICLDYFTDPVILDCGHNFCATCIAECWRLSPRSTACPQCRERVHKKKLRPNSQLANIVEIAKDLSDLLKYRGVLSVEEADHEFAKDRINRSLEILKKDRENILIYKAENEKESQDLLIQIEEEREKTTAAFRKHHQFLEAQEKLLLDQMEEVEKEIEIKRDQNLARLSAELSSLDNHIQEMEEKQQQSLNELQNIGNILERCKKNLFKNPGAFPAELRWKVHNFTDINPFLEGILKQFTDTLQSGLQSHQEDVSLDSISAHPQHVLSENYKSVRWGEEGQDLDSLEGFDEELPFLLGRQGFTTGRHFWDVDVDGDEEWSVGVAKGSLWLKDRFGISPKKGIWDMGKWDGAYRVSVPLDNHPLLVSQDVRKVRVNLNYDGGRVAFFDADTGILLYVYTNANFNGMTIHPYFSVSGGGHLTILP